MIKDCYFIMDALPEILLLDITLEDPETHVVGTQRKLLSKPVSSERVSIARELIHSSIREGVKYFEPNVSKMPFLIPPTI